MDCKGMKSRFVVELEVLTEFGHMNRILEGIMKFMDRVESKEGKMVKIGVNIKDVGVVRDENI
jgi:hypothetical protein